MLFILGLLVCAGAITLLAHRAQALLARSATHALSRSFGTEISMAGAPEVHLLPRPRVVLTDVRLQAPEFSPIEVPVLEATQSLGSLLSGRLTFSRLRLVGPRMTVDADGLARGFARPPLGLLAHGTPERIVVESGVLTLRSAHAALQGVMTGIDTVIDGLDRNGPAVVSGHGTWRGMRLDLSAKVEPFYDFMLGRDVAGSVKLRSPLLTAAADGRLHAGIRGGFDGKVAASTPSLSNVLRVNGLPAGMGQVAERVSFSGSSVANADTVTFSDARVVLDDTPFEGSLAWQPNDGRWAWTGTFATDTLDLTRLLAALPALRDRSGRWSDAPWSVNLALLGDVDLRISASRALLGPLTIEDAAFSALCQNGRIEAGFSEARSLDGLVRGRAVAAVDGRGIDLRVDLSMSQMDIDPLARAAGAKGMSGTASGHLVAEARGASARALVDNLGGHGQVSVRDGSLPALPSIADLSSLGLDAPQWLRSRATLPFDLVTADLQLVGNRLKIIDGRVVEPSGQQAFAAEASLLDRSFSLVAMPDSSTGTAVTNLVGVFGSPPRILRAAAETTRSPGAALEPTLP